MIASTAQIADMLRLVVIDAWSGEDTGELDDFAHAVIKAVMFLGRVGLVKLGFSSLHQKRCGCAIPRDRCILVEAFS